MVGVVSSGEIPSERLQLPESVTIDSQSRDCHAFIVVFCDSSNLQSFLRLGRRVKTAKNVPLGPCGSKENLQHA
jgi:hypothetical protein